MRANRASEVCTSSETRSRLTVGNNSRACSVVNATIVPALRPRAGGDQEPGHEVDQRRGHPEERLTTAKNDCPVIAWRTWRSTCRAFSARYRCTS